jgi:hypothetical protein
MRVARGKVVGNTVVLDEPLSDGTALEGSPVTVYLEEDGWKLDEADTRELLEAVSEADRGEVVSADEALADLPPRK